MSEFKGTKGKWEIFIDSVIKSEIFIMAGEIPVIRIALNNYVSKKEAKANAKLIACAPEMLEMLNSVLEQENISQSAHDEIVKLIQKATK